MQLINYLKETIKKEQYLAKFIIILFIIGVAAGSLFINIITKSDKTILMNQITNFIESSGKLSKDIFGINAFYKNFLNNFIQLLFIFILGLSVIGMLAVIFIIFYKGFMLGTTLGTFILKYKLKGSIGILLYVVPCQIINILIYVFICFYALHVSLKFIKALFKKDNLNFKNFIGKYILSFIITFILIIMSSLLDSYIMPLLMKCFFNIIKVG